MLKADMSIYLNIECQGEWSMKKTICILLAAIGLMMAASSCTKITPSTEEPATTAPNTAAVDSEPHGAAFKGGAYLQHMDDLKAINLAANYLKELGETVTYQETYIEFHEAQEAAVEIALAEGKSVEYAGDYLEIRFYNSDDPKNDPCEDCTVVYISQDGKILGQNKIFQDDVIKEDSQPGAEDRKDS
jgi:hypothetical protein